MSGKQCESWGDVVNLGTDNVEKFLIFDSASRVRRYAFWLPDVPGSD